MCWCCVHVYVCVYVCASSKSVYVLHSVAMSAMFRYVAKDGAVRTDETNVFLSTKFCTES